LNVQLACLIESCIITMDLEEQKEVWRKEQLAVASQVVILPDPVLRSSSGDDRFQVVPILSSLDTDANTDDTNHKDNESSKSNSDSPPRLYFGGVDVSFPNDDDDDDDEATKGTKPAVAVYVILDYPSGTIVYCDSEFFVVTIPYLPSYLAFREIDPLVRLIEKQRKSKPEVTPKAILVDGNGLFHSRQAGIACFVGVRTGVPTIGVGKTLFCEGNLTKTMVLQQLQESLEDAKTVFINNNPSQPAAQHNQQRKNKVLCCGRDVVIIDSQSIPKQQEEEVKE
jgi:deoxyinosine 3'endonuclease (endonuclease V)